MGVKRYKPNHAGRRIASVDDFVDITKKRPERALTLPRKQMAGRSNGKITVRHRGGGAKRRIRILDSLRNKFDVSAKVAAIEYDPNRGARLALLHYVDGSKAYMIAPMGTKTGDTVLSSKTRGEVQPGNRYPLDQMPIGIAVHDIELQPGRGGQAVRSAGASAQLLAVEGAYATVRMPSSEVRMIPKECMATIGQVSNQDRRLIRWGKAGRMRHRGIRPSVRGKAMNPVDHPHGGGEGKHSIGMKHPKTPWGKPALGVKTRRKARPSQRLIVARRKKGRFVGEGK